ANARSRLGSRRWPTIGPSCCRRGSERPSSVIRLPWSVDTRSASGGVMLEIDPMADWLALFSALLGGGVAAGVLFYLVGRRVERRTAEAAARAAAVETERQLGGARQRVVLAARARLEQIAGLTAEEAKQELLRRLEDEARNDAAALARDLKEQARRSADKEAKKILALAIQRLAPESTAETTVSAVALPSDEMKGRIIGREGRNIRAFEAATGVDVIIDDTPDTVVVSCFDPVRREVGRLALERLVTD